MTEAGGPLARARLGADLSAGAAMTALQWWALSLALGAVSIASATFATSGPVAWSVRVTALAMLATAALLLAMS
jgi:hypothetical protein